MATPTAAQVADNWQRGMQNSTERLKAGINAVDVAPTAKAAAAVDRQVQGVIAAAQSGKTQRALQAVSLQDWKDAMLKKGVARVAQGAAAATPKFQSFMTKFLPYLKQGQDKVNSMPNATLEDRIQRMVAMVRHNSEFTNT